MILVLSNFLVFVLVIVIVTVPVLVLVLDVVLVLRFCSLFVVARVFRVGLDWLGLGFWWVG